jgi:LysR family glycine cleavage system transcriptional activator
MLHKLPPLNTLRAFKVAAHTLSFTEAANELNVTQAAISHQIKALEVSLDKQLFKRGNRSLTLTESGSRFLPFVDRMFSVLEEGADQVMQSDESMTLTVSVIPSFAARWLVPRLGLFIKACPEIDFRLAPSSSLTNFARENIDLAIRHGGGKYPGLDSIHLLDEQIYPVCHPRLLQGKHGLKTPADLKHQVLLHDDGHGDWRTWLLAADVHDVDVSRGPVYTDSSMAVQSAIEGDGVALARSQLVKSDIVRGLLVRPFNISQPSKFAYYVVYPQDKPVTAQMSAFITWLQQQVVLDEEKYGGLVP